jgi:hypothetical protein
MHTPIVKIITYCFTTLQNGFIQNTATEAQKPNDLFRSDHSRMILPMNSESEDSGYDMEELESELEGRRLRVWEVCVAHGLNMEGEPNAWEFFIDSTHGLVWCNIFKAASSTWLYNFNLLGKCIKNVFFYFSNKQILSTCIL